MKFSVLLIFLFFYIYIEFMISHNYSRIINFDNDNQISEYEKNINFSNSKTDIKAIALYLPQFHSIKENDIWWGKGFTEWFNVKKSKALYKWHHQPRIPLNKNNYLGYYKLTDASIIKKQVELAKSHGIYGFAIYYYWFSGKRLLEKPLNIYLMNKDITFPFLLIWANENWTRKWDGNNKDILIKQEYKDDDPENFIRDIKIYLIDDRYIKINEKKVLGIYEPTQVPKLNETLIIWRKKSKEYGIGEIFILVCINEFKNEIEKNVKLFDGAYDFPPRIALEHHSIKFKNSLIYSEVINKNILFYFNKTNKEDFQIYRGSMLEWDNSPRVKECLITDYYSPEQFYRFNKILIDWTKQKYNKSNQFIFINAWNEWGEGSYLEPDKKYGYASINSLSKALFHLPFIKKRNLNYFRDICKIAIHVHLFNEDLIDGIINKTNSIGYKYDLYISLYNKYLKKKIENYIIKKSKSNKIEIKVYQNRGRDILPIIHQLKDKIRKYKYFCHIHNKNHFHIGFENEWRNYLYNNLLGDNEIISEILSDFENNKKLGFIIPEAFYKILEEFGKRKYDSNNEYMNFIIKKKPYIFRINLNDILFPLENMFWAKVASIYQIFELTKIKLFHRHNRKMKLILIQGFQIIWFYILKLNGCYYKKIFKHL